MNHLGDFALSHTDFDDTPRGPNGECLLERGHKIPNEYSLDEMSCVVFVVDVPGQ
jgi:hypothetical protein